MSRQKVGFAMRSSLWKAHEQKCAYCGEYVSLAELQADHIIPEAVWSDPSLAGLLADLDLPSDFDLTSPSNLLPAHGRCNRLKMDDVYKLGALHFYLARAEKKAPQIAELIASLKRHEKRETLLSQLSEALTSGVITHMDIRLEQSDPSVLKLSKPLVFADGLEYSVTPEQVPLFLDRPVLIGGNPDFDAAFGNEDGVKMRVRTCREYRAALQAGYFALTTIDMKSEAFLKPVYAVLLAAETVRLPHLSYIDRPFKGLADLDLLPVDVLPTISPDYQSKIEAMGGQTLKDLLDRGELKILRVSSGEISVEWHWGLLMREICRADLDHDGIEDILCECYCWAIGGTMGFGWTCLLKRLSADEPFSISRL
jgi:hypothetical protein